MSESIRRESHSPVPCWNPDDGLTAKEPSGPMPHAAFADWLLLLPIGPGAVGLDLGCGDGALSLDLAHHCDKVVAVDPDATCVDATQRRAAEAGLCHVSAHRGDLGALVNARRRFDVVVVRDPRRVLHGMGASRAAERLVELIQPRGCLAIAVGAPPETRMPFGSARRPRGARLPWLGEYGASRLRRALEAAGLQDVQILAAVSDPHQPECVFPVAGPGQGRVPGRLVSRCLWPGGGPRRMLLRTALALSQWRAARWLSPAFWVIARGPGSMRAAAAEEMVRNIVARPSGPDSRRTDPAERARVSLRARQLSFVVSRQHGGTGEHAALLAVPMGWRDPACVLRAQRWRGGTPMVADEQVDLSRLRSRLVGRLRDSIPAPLGATEVRDHHAAAHAYLPGVPLHQSLRAAGPRRIRGLVEQVLPRITEWLAELHEQTGASTWIEAEGALERVRPMLVPVAGAERVAGGPLLEAVAVGIARAGTRLGVAHNRLEPCHVLVQEDGIAVTGWEHAAFEGLPLVDLLGLANALGEMLAGGSRVSPGDASRFTYLEDNWYSRAVRLAVDRYCDRTGIASEAVPFYLATTYLRAAALYEPLGVSAASMGRVQLALNSLEWR